MKHLSLSCLLQTLWKVLLQLSYRTLLNSEMCTKVSLEQRPELFFSCSSLSLSAYLHRPTPALWLTLWLSTGLIPTGKCPLCFGDPKPGQTITGGVSQVQSGERESPPLTCWSHFFWYIPGWGWFSEYNHPMWSHVDLFIHKLYPGLVFSHSLLSFYLWLGLPQLRCRKFSWCCWHSWDFQKPQACQGQHLILVTKNKELETSTKGKSLLSFLLLDENEFLLTGTITYHRAIAKSTMSVQRHECDTSQRRSKR